MTATLDIAVMRIGTDGCARFSFGPDPRMITGRQRVAAHYIQTLLCRPGSIFTSPAYGGGLLDSDANQLLNEGELDTAVMAAVSKAERDVKVEQNNHPTEPADRLANVQVLEAYYDASARVYYLKLEITTEAGESEIVQL